ncbi:MAG: NADP transhydrogenase subunit alpha, partial [Firmicutes bacterium]|nr:NADP transhydrogenase subunit alpha [Bacillota bacterium]
VDGRNLYESIQANRSYRGLKAPQTDRHRYLTEDVPTGLVPMVSLGKALGLPMAVMESLVRMAECLHRVEYSATGRTVESLGLAGLGPAAIRRTVELGFAPQAHRAGMEG